MAPTDTRTCACPHCQTTYPLLPQLVGRPIRCRSCKNIFQVGGNGVAVPVVVNRPATEGRPATKAAEAPASVDQPPSTSFHRGRKQASSTGGSKPKTTRIAASMRRSLHSGDFQAAAKDAGEDDSEQPAPAAPVAEAAPVDKTAPAAEATTDDFQRALADEQDDSDGAPAPASGIFDDDLAPTPDSTPGSKPISTHFKGRRGAVSSVVDAIRQTMRTAARSSVSRAPEPTSERQVRPDNDAIEREFQQRVACPECQAAYPFEESMAGQMMRCRSCHAVFRIFEGAQSAPAIVNRPKAPSRRPRIRRAKDSLDLAAIDADVEAAAEERPADRAPKPKPKQRKGKDAGRGSRIMRTKDLIDEMNRKMHGITGAVDDQQQKEELQQVGRKKRSSTTIDRLLQPHAPAKKQVRLTGEGVAAHRQRWLVAGILAAVIAVIVLLVRTLGGLSPEQQVLADLVRDQSYHEPDGARRTIDGFSKHACHTPAPVQPIVVGDEVVFGTPWRADMAAMTVLRNEVAERYLHRPSGMWVLRTDRLKVDELWERHQAEQGEAGAFGLAMREAGIDCLPQKDLAVRFQAIGFSPTAAGEVMRFIFANCGDHTSFFHEEFVLKGVPQAIEGLPFHGKQGRLILPMGKTMPRDYEGLLIRVIRNDQPGPWKVFRLETTGR